MRGRTNASNGGIFLNAITDNFEVATGNSIVAGDFVEYKYDTGVKELSGTIEQRAKNYLVDATTSLYIALINNIPTLFTYANDTITVVATYPYNATYLVKHNDTTYIASDSNVIYVLSIDVTNQSFTLLGSKSGIGYITMKFSDTIYLGITSQNTYSDGAINVYNCSDFTNITRKKSNTGLSLGIQFAVYDNTFYSLYGAMGSSYGRLYLTPWTFSADGTATRGTPIQIDGTGSSAQASTSRAYVLSEGLFNNRYVIFAYLYGSYTSPNDQIAVFDFEQMSLVIKDYFSPYLLDSSVFSSNINSDGEIVIGTIATRAISLFKFDATNISLTRLDTKDIDNQTWKAIFDFPNKKHALLTYNSGYTPFSASNNQIAIGELTDSVKEWTGNGNPMGVAKQSGNAGDTIAVYIPQVNS